MYNLSLKFHSQTGDAKLRISTSAPQPPSSPLHHTATTSATTTTLGHEVGITLSLPNPNATSGAGEGGLRVMLESRNADTPRGFVLDLKEAIGGVKVR